MTEGVVMLLTGPLQSWGGPAPGIYERPTDTMPSLSAVIGIVANALGRQRVDDIADIAVGAKLAVRSDRPGSILEDFHTVGTPGRYALAADTRKQLKHPVPTRRQYLEDAAFLAVYTPPPGGIAAEDVLEALLLPARPLYLGRRSCPPAERIPVCSTNGRTPLAVLEQAPLMRCPASLMGNASERLSNSDYFARTAGPDPKESAVIEMTAEDTADPLTTTLRPDSPTTFDPRRLHHENRRTTRLTLTYPADACAGRGSKAVAILYAALGAEQ